jgi:hypothetical protein
VGAGYTCFVAIAVIGRTVDEIAGCACRQAIAQKDGAGAVSQPELLSCLTGVDDPSIKEPVMRAFVAGATVPSLVAAGHEVHGIALHHEPPHPHRPPGRQQIAEATVAAVEHGSRGVYNVVDDEPAPVAEWLPALARELGARKPMRGARQSAAEVTAVQMTEIRGASNGKPKRELCWLPRHPSWRQGFAAA